MTLEFLNFKIRNNDFNVADVKIKFFKNDVYF